MLSRVRDCRGRNRDALYKASGNGRRRQSNKCRNQKTNHKAAATRVHLSLIVRPSHFPNSNMNGRLRCKFPPDRNICGQTVARPFMRGSGLGRQSFDHFGSNRRRWRSFFVSAETLWKQGIMKMMKLRASLLAMSAAVLLAGCAEEPMGPTIPVMPAQGKSQAEFAQDDAACQQYAHERIAGQVDRANNDQVASTLLGTAIGAGLGAAVGNTRGAVVGGAAGAAVGASAGPGPYAGYGIQRQFNIAYAQCMSSHGDQVPQRPMRPYGPPPGYYPPPPPPGYGPPPPPPGN
jgi:hypothetical protein